MPSQKTSKSTTAAPDKQPHLSMTSESEKQAHGSSTTMPPREDILIPFGRARMSAWLYRSPTASKETPGPAIVLGHGLGGFKSMRLDAYSEVFQQAGYTAVAFDYRGFGESTGSTAQILDYEAQQADWDVALEYVRNLEYVDPERLAVFGTSFGGAHAITIASRDKRLKAAISQCPFTSGPHSAMTVHWRTLPQVLYASARDWLFGTRDSFVPIKLAGHPGEPALMNAPDVMPAFDRFIPKEYQDAHPEQQYVAARIALQMPFLAPGKDAKNVECPIYFAICTRDTVAPPKPTLAYAQTAPKGEIKEYNAGHFDIYFDEHFDEASKDYVSFLTRVLPLNQN